MTKSLKDKQSLYRQVLGNEAGRELLSDLNVFCFGTKTTLAGSVDVIELARREGRREVFLQIMRMLKVDIHDIYEEYVDDEF